MFTLGVALALSVLNVYFRDLQYFVGILLQFWFYATPVVYPISLVAARREDEVFGISVYTLYSINPMVGFVELFRDVLYDVTMPDLSTLAYVTAWSVASLIAGYALFRRFEGRLAEEL